MSHTEEASSIADYLELQNFHRYTDYYERERQTLLSRIDDLQIANVRLQDKLLIQEKHNKSCEQQNEQYGSVPSGRSLNRRASLYDGSWSKSLPSTMISPFAPTIFSPTVSLNKTGKPNLAVSIPDNSSLAFSTNSNASRPPISVTVEPTTWSASSPFSPQFLSTPWQSRADKNSTYYEFQLTESQPKADWILQDVPLAFGSWADSDFEDDDALPPATAVSAPAGSFHVQSQNVDQNLRYAMVLIDVSHVKVSSSGSDGDAGANAT